MRGHIYVVPGSCSSRLWSCRKQISMAGPDYIGRSEQPSCIPSRQTDWPAIKLQDMPTRDNSPVTVSNKNRLAIRLKSSTVQITVYGVSMNMYPSQSKKDKSLRSHFMKHLCHAIQKLEMKLERKCGEILAKSRNQRGDRQPGRLNWDTCWDWSYS